MQGKNFLSPIYLSISFALVTNVMAFAGAAEEYPKALSYCVEQTGENNLTILAYPKYYLDEQKQWQRTAESVDAVRDGEWFAKQEHGIYQFACKQDGTVQLGHLGARFTYSLEDIVVRDSEGNEQSLGLVRNAGSTPLVIKNAVRWVNFFDGVDVEMLYNPDQFKETVYIDDSARKKIEAGCQSIKNIDDCAIMLKFAVKEFFSNGLVMKDKKQDRDFMESFKVEGDLGFYKDGRLKHSFPLEYAYMPGFKNIFDTSELRADIIKEFVSKNEKVDYYAGIALATFLKAQEGTIEIDPSQTYQEGVNPSGYSVPYSGCEDSILYRNDFITPTPSVPPRSDMNYGGSTELWSWAQLVSNSVSETRPILRFKGLEQFVGDPKEIIISSASLSLYLRSITGSTTSNYRAVPYALKDATATWNEKDGWQGVYDEGVSWTYKQYKANVNEATKWESPGAGTLDRSIVAGNTINMPNQTIGQWVTWTLNPSVVQDWYSESRNGTDVDGLVIEIIDKLSNEVQYCFPSSEWADTSVRPKLDIAFYRLKPTTLTPTPEQLNLEPMQQPYSDTFAYPFLFGDKWYITCNSAFRKSGTENYCTVFLMQMNSNTGGLAAPTKSSIENSLLRVTPGNQTPVPGTAGTPYPAFQAPYLQFTPIPTPPNVQTPFPPKYEWYGRMAAISSAYVEMNASPTPSPMKIHAFFHAEDNHHYITGQSYGKDFNNIAHANYARIGYVISVDGINFTQVNASVDKPTEPGPVVRSYMSEAEWVYPPYGTPIPTQTPGGSTPTPYLETGIGVRHPWIIKKGNYLYMFYDKVDSDRYVLPIIYPACLPTGLPTPRPNIVQNLKKSLKIRMTDQKRIFDQSICVARANYNDFLQYKPTPSVYTSPWKNYFFDNPTPANWWGEPANGGWSTPLFNEQLECPSAIYNAYLCNYILTTSGYASGHTPHRLYIHLNQDDDSSNSDDDMVRWTDGLRLDFVTPSGFGPYYGYFVNATNTTGFVMGDVNRCGQDAYLYFLPDGSTSFPMKTSRIKIRFE